MKYKKFESENGMMTFRIEEDYPEVGSYLYVYEKGKCIYDSLQNSIKDCMEFALEEYGIPLDTWQEIIE